MTPDISKIGLTSAQAEQKLAQEGPNVLPAKDQRSLLTITWDIIREPMILLLVIAAILYLTFGDLQEGLALVAFVALIIFITLYQEGKAEHALEALKNLSSPRALVVRDGEPRRISGREVVRDDLIIIGEGDRIPADGILISTHDLQIDESLLTGESFPVFKTESDAAYSGTMVAQGQGTLLVKATGKNTQMGRIGVELQTLKREISPLQKQTEKIVKIFAMVGLFVSISVVLLLGLQHGNWLQAALAGIALAMSLLPEEFAVILTIFPALGAWRLSKQQVLTRQISAIETLGAISVLCVDKTGTLTENAMRVTELWVLNESPETLKKLCEFSILASEIQPLDPMEKAFHELGKVSEHWKLIHEYDLTPELTAKSHVWQTDDPNVYTVAAKGSPEAIVDLCHLDDEMQQKIAQATQKLAQKGLRVLAVAQANFIGRDWPSHQHVFDFKFLGLLGLSDPLRKGITQAVTQCYEAGIKIIMITGDYPETAKTIAQQAGIHVGDILTGDEVNHLNDKQLQEKIKNISIFARITPAEKLKIVQALKANGEIVGMTGDGVNDAPALKAAHVSIAMGKRGTDVAREASSIVLLDDNFISIVGAIDRGRCLFDNIQKSISYILAVHVPIACMALIPVLIGWPSFFYPMHIAFLQLIIDPACSLVFENEPPESNVMKRPPRNPAKPLISKRSLLLSLFQGLGIFVIIFIAYYLALQNMTEEKARAFAFSTLIFANLMLIFASLTKQKSIFKSLIVKNKILNFIVFFTLISLILVLYWPFLATLFQFSPLTFYQFIMSFIIGISSILVLGFASKLFALPRD